MTLKQRNRWLVVAIITLAASSIGCNFLSHRIVTPTAEPVPVTTEAAENLQESIESGLEEFQSTGEITFEITESQLTSLIAVKLREQPDAPIKDPQILLRDGQIKFSAAVNQGNFSFPLAVVITLGVDAQGMPTYEIVSASVGPLPLPDNLKEQLSSQIDQVLSTQLVADNTPVYLDSITIADGILTIKAHRR